MNLHQVHSVASESQGTFLMPNGALKIAIALSIVLIPPAALAGSASKMGTPPQPHIAAQTQPSGSRNPAAPPSMSLDQQSLPEAPVGHRQPRADQVPSEQNLMDPNDPINKENAALDRMINGICRGC